MFRKPILLLATASVFALASPALARDRTPVTAAEQAAVQVRHKTVMIDGVDIFYREAGRADAPAILLLHGFPSSSHMFRNLIPALADKYRVVAPDYPGFGYSAAPDRSAYAYTFESLYGTVDKFTRAVGLDRFAVYVHDYGAPIGFRLASQQPERVTALLVQNGNAYDVGLGSIWAPIRAYWEMDTPENRDALRGFLTAKTTHWQYTHGVADMSLVSPDAYTHDQRGLDRPGNQEVQLDLFGDCRNNLPLHSGFQEYFRKSQPPTLITWGKNDEIFVAAGAEAFRKDLPKAEVHMLDTGHFALETHGPQIATLIRDFLERNVAGKRAGR